MSLKAPFPYYGGKRRWAPIIWEKLGGPDVYVEPFAGSLACLLARPGGAGPREIVCDLDGGICNFWRAVAADPEQVAYYADYPTIHADLTARHQWLVGWLKSNRERLSEDPFFYSALAAGWWVWGMSLWIGGGWCEAAYDKRPHVMPNGGGQGVSPQRVSGGMPHVGKDRSGQGISAQTVAGRPWVHNGTSGRGVNAQRPRIEHSAGVSGVNAPRGIPHIYDRHGGRGEAVQRALRPDLVQWFHDLQARLKQVVVLNRPWQAALTPTLLWQTATCPPGTIVGVLLDPPYSTKDRAATLYGSDLVGQSDDAAAASWAWALEHGDRYRIAYCCHEGDVDIPPGWDVQTASFGGINIAARRSRKDMVLFSPACVGQRRLL